MWHCSQLLQCSSRSISSARRAHSSRPAACCCNIRQMGQTPYRYIDPAAYYTSSVKNTTISNERHQFSVIWERHTAPGRCRTATPLPKPSRSLSTLSNSTSSQLRCHLHGRSSTNAFGSCNSIKIPLSYIITIIITIKDIYIAQVRKGHKCAMSAEMAVWLCNCRCISHVLCLCTYTVQRTSLHRYSLDSSYPSISAACTQAVGDINQYLLPTPRLHQLELSIDSH